MTEQTSGSALHYFAEGNTARGFVHLFDSSLQGLDRLYILKGGPGTGKSTLIRSIGDSLRKQGIGVWLIHCALDPDSLDGVIIPAWKAGIVDGTSPHVIEPRLPGAVEEIVNLGTAWDSAALRKRKPEIERLHEQIRQSLDRAYAGFAEALRIHDEWEAVYIQNMDYQAADQLTKETIQRLFGERKQERTSRVDRRFLGAATPRGSVDFVPNLTEGLTKRYFLKGRPGSGKSTMLKQIAGAAAERGFDAEIYHCGFDPDSVDMVIVRELGFAIFDSTAPHEYFPGRQGDEIIDMYERCIRPGTDEQHADALKEIQARYKAAIKQATASLAEAKSWHDALESVYVQAMDFSQVDQIRGRIQEELHALAQQPAH